MMDNLQKSIYYVSISALQKCIRRNRVKDALIYGKICYFYDKFRLWKRLWTILFEDCGRNLDALRTFYNQCTYEPVKKSYDGVVPLIKAMASGPHDKQPCALSDILLLKYGTQESWINAIDCTPGMDAFDHPLKQLINEGPEYIFKQYESMRFVVIDGNSTSFVSELAERSAKFDYSGFGTASPFFFLDGVYEDKLKVNVADNLNPTEMYGGFFPLCALDEHTFQGKTIINSFLKWNRTIKLTSEDFGWLLFVSEGQLMNRYSPFSFDFYQFAYSRFAKPTPTGNAAWYLKSDLIERMQSNVLSKLNVARKWYIEHPFADIFKQIRVLYDRIVKEFE